MSRLRVIAVEELTEIVEAIKASCDKLESGGSAEEFTRSALLRFHTIAGSAALAGFDAISDIGAGVEALFKTKGDPKPEKILTAARDAVTRIEELLNKTETES